MTNIKERVLHIAEHYGVTKEKFFQELELSYANFKGKQKESALSSDAIDKILTKYPNISTKWLIKGEGDIEAKHEAIPVTAGIVKYIPLVSQYAQAGYLSGFGDETYIESLPTIPVILTKEAKGDYVCFEVSGDSMISDMSPEESIFEGDLLVCKNVDKCYWTSKLHINKWDFVIVHKEEGVIVKRITDHEVENGDITLHSLNSMYEDRTLSLKEVDKIFKVVKVIRERKR